MLPRGSRLSSGDDIREVIKRGKRIGSPFFTLHYLPSEQNRFAVVTGRVLGNAVIRNKIKRRITNCVRDLQTIAPSSISGVFRMKLSALNCDFSELEVEVQKAFEGLKP